MDAEERDYEEMKAVFWMVLFVLAYTVFGLIGMFTVARWFL